MFFQGWNATNTDEDKNKWTDERTSNRSIYWRLCGWLSRSIPLLPLEICWWKRADDLACERVPMISEVEAVESKRHRFLVCLTSWVMQNTLISPSLAPAWRETVEQQRNWCHLVWVCIHVRRAVCVCVWLSMHTVLNLPRERIHSLIKYSPATTGSQLPAAIVHTHCRIIGAWCIRWKQRPIKSLSSRFLGDHFSSLCGSFSSVTATRLHLDTPDSHLSKSSPGCKAVCEE